MIFYNNHLDSKTVFITFTLINHLRLVITFMFANSVSTFSEVYTSLRRITNFLNLEESNNLNKNFIDNQIQIELNIKNLSSSYSNSESKNLIKKTKKEVKLNDENDINFDQEVLKNINLRCKPG